MQLWQDYRELATHKPEPEPARDLARERAEEYMLPGERKVLAEKYQHELEDLARAKEALDRRAPETYPRVWLFISRPLLPFVMGILFQRFLDWYFS